MACSVGNNEVDNGARNVYGASMDAEDLRQELETAQGELEELAERLEPLVARREWLRRRIQALQVLLHPDSEGQEMLWEPAPGRPSPAWQLRDIVPTYRTLEPGGDFVSGPTTYEAKAYAKRKRLDVQPAADAGRVIEEILREAGKPLHRDEIYQRGRVHPLGPVNRNTMISRLSRDSDVFENVSSGGRAGYWALKAWPEDQKMLRPDEVSGAGRQYAALLNHLQRTWAELSETREQTTRLQGWLAGRVREMGDREPGPEMERHLRQLEEANQSLHEQVTREARIRAVLSAQVTEANELREALGPEAEDYPDLPDLHEFLEPRR